MVKMVKLIVPGIPIENSGNRTSYPIFQHNNFPLFHLNITFEKNSD